MKVFTAAQIREIDKATIQLEPISSVDLMERAAGEIFFLLEVFITKLHKVVVICGQGNNGGDGFVLGRMINNSGFNCMVYVVQSERGWSEDALTNYERYRKLFPEKIKTIGNITDLPTLDISTIVVDAIFKIGLNRPVEGPEAEVIKFVNDTEAIVISVDIPSGLFAEDNSDNTGAIMQADFTITIQTPYLSFFFPENARFVGEWYIAPIGLHKETIFNTPTPYIYVDDELIAEVFRTRKKFAYKNNFGHALLVAGSKDKPGAAVLAAKACMRSGCGLLTMHVPKGVQACMVEAVPEAMLQVDENDNDFTMITGINSYDAVGVGPGLGTGEAVRSAFRLLLTENKHPLVLDADALNMISQEKDLLNILPENTILTPHIGEFKRLFGDYENSYLRLQAQMDLSVRYRIIIVCKGAYTAVTTPDGHCYFNSTGNQGMATAGSGDVLTGIILSLLSQGYDAAMAAIFGVWLHGRAGDLALDKQSYESLIAGDIINNIGGAFKTINK